jgi:hypothetical protein
LSGTPKQAERPSGLPRAFGPRNDEVSDCSFPETARDNMPISPPRHCEARSDAAILPHCHCEARSAVAIHAAVRFSGTPEQPTRPSGLPRACGPRNDDDLPGVS